MNSDERFPIYPIPGQDISKHSLFISFREILICSLILSAGTALVVSLANDYLVQGLWYLVFLAMKRYVIIFFSGLIVLHLLFFIIGRIFSPRITERLKQLIILGICIYAAFLVLDYSGLLLRFVDRVEVIRLAHYAASIVTGAFLFLLVKSGFRRRSPSTHFGFYSIIPALIIGTFFVASPSLVTRNSDDRNVVLITVDTLRADHIGCYGYARNTSPNLDDFASRAIVFENPIVQWPKTSPSFSSILTSLYCGQTGVKSTRQKLPWRMTTTAEILKNEGYVTAGIVGNGNLATGYNFDQGFTYYVEAWKDDSVPVDRRCDAKHITDRALEMLERLVSTERFFLWIHYIDPHSPYSPPPPFDEMFVGDEYYGDRKIKLNDGFDDDIGGCPGRSRLGYHDNLDYYIAQYDAEIRYNDSEMKRVFDFLRDNGLEKNTMIVISSDHGESLGEHNYFFEHGKFSYEPSLRVPLIIHIPGYGHHRVKQPVALLDIHPTILDYTGLNSKVQSEGRSLIDWMSPRGVAGGSRRIFTQSGGPLHPVWTVRDDRWKLIYIPTPKFRNMMTGSTYEFYDLQNDPFETLNVYSPENSLAMNLRKDLEQWIETKNRNQERAGRVYDPGDESTNENLRALGYIE